MSRVVLKTIAIASLFASFGLTACNPTLRTHGYVATENDKPQEIEPGADTKATVLARLGNPSTTGTFEQDTWYYMTSVRQRLAYLRPITEERQITAVVFNDDGQVQAVAEYGLEDGRIVDFVGRETPTRGRQVSVLEQIFGTIGRLPTDQLTRGQNDIPGGGGSGSGRR
ncbi:MAG: outer membrane protein assembly factor BamE [Robiginitomaculum sp.]